jgi:hypothetical protein
MISDEPVSPLLETRGDEGDALRQRVFGSEEESPPVVQNGARSKRRHRLVKIAAGLVVTLLALAAIGAGAVVWLGTEGGHAWLARQLEENISSQIRGHLTVGHLDHADLHHVVARDVTFWDESGRPVIEADEVEMSYELDELVGGHFVSHASHAHGGRVILETNAEGELLINRAFRSSHPGPPGQPVGPDVVHLENLEVTDVTVTMALGDAPVATLRRLAATVLVRAPDRGAAIVEADHVHGGLHVAAPIPFDLRVIAGSLAVDGAAHRRIHIDLPARMGSERIGIEVTALARPDETLTVDARIRPHGLGAMLSASGMISQAMIAETQSPLLDVTVELQ